MRHWMRWGVVLVATWGTTASAKEYRKPPTEQIDWPLPWATGASLDYDESNERFIEFKGVGTHTISRSITRISTLRREDDGFVQGWTTLAVIEREQADPQADREMAQAIEDAFGKMTLEVKLAQDGTYAGIANLAPIQARLQQLVNQMRTKSRPVRQGRQQPAAADLQAMRDRLLAAYTSGPVLEGLLSALTTAYNFVAGGGVGLDYEYVYADLGANPVGGAPFPMTGRMTLRRDELREGWLMMEWSTAIDRVKGGPILAATVRKLLGPDALSRSGKEASDALEQVADNLDIGSSTRFRIDPATGIVQWMQMVQRRRIGDRNDVRTTTLNLRSEPYVPGLPDGKAAHSGAGL